MARHRQTIFGNGADGSTPGNCLQASVATLLDASDLDLVPHFCRPNEDPDGLWWYALHGFCATLDPPQRLVEREVDPRNPWVPERPCIVSGRSPRGEWAHAIVYFGNGDWWDPHPDDTGLAWVDKVEWIEPW